MLGPRKPDTVVSCQDVRSSGEDTLGVQNSKCDKWDLFRH